MNKIFSKDNLISAGIAGFFYFLHFLIGAWWIGIGFSGIGLLYIAYLLYKTNWCKPGSCNGIFFLPGLLSLFMGTLFIIGSLVKLP